MLALTKSETIDRLNRISHSNFTFYFTVIVEKINRVIRIKFGSVVVVDIASLSKLLYGTRGATVSPSPQHKLLQHNSLLMK